MEPNRNRLITLSKNDKTPIIKIIPILFGTFLIVLACKKLEVQRKALLISGSEIEIKARSAKAQASIIDLGQGIIDYGHCWSLSQNPDTSDFRTSLGIKKESGEYISSLFDLLPSTQYYVRAYINNGNEIIYGEETYFTTLDGTKATLSTGKSIIIDSTTISILGKIENLGQGYDTVYYYGHCWSQETLPTIDDNKTEFGPTSIKTEFVSTIENLEAGMIYHARAYAINPAGVSYGDPVPFATSELKVPEVQTIGSINYTLNSITCAGKIISKFGFNIEKKGIYLSSTPEFTDNEITVESSDPGDSFNSLISDLNTNTEYYIRAFAETEVGTGMGEVLKVKTAGLKDIDGNEYRTVKIGNQTWMAENLKTKHYADGTSIENGTGLSVMDDYNAKYYFYYKDDSITYSQLGLYYTWSAVMKGSESSSSNPSGVRGVCPSGWHVPSDNEWMELEMELGMTSHEANSLGFRGDNQGDQIKLDGSSGFNALFGGARAWDGSYFGLNSEAIYRTATQYNDEQVYGRNLNSGPEIGRGTESKLDATNKRCVKDN